MKKISKLLLLIVALCMLGGCDDTLKESDGNVAPGNEHLSYLCVNITTSDGNSAGTRAWGDDSAGEAADAEFDPGFEGEWALAPEPESHWLFFFNQDGTFHSASRLSEMDLTNVGTGEYPDNKEKTLGTFVAKVDISKGQAKPASCLAVINGRPSRMQDLELKLERNETNGKTAAKWLMTKLTDPLAGDELTNEGPIIAFYTPTATGSARINYCTMTNAVYVPGEGGFATQTGKVKVLQEIPDSKLCDTQDQAKKNALTIHVERMAVKMEVEFTGKTKTEKVKEEGGEKPIEGYDFPVVLKPEGDDNKVNQKEEGSSSSTSKSWAAAIWGWRINAVAKQTYLFKNLDDATAGELDKGTATAKPKYSSSEDKVNEQFFANWNDANRFRSYWAVDPHYANADIYPTQYRRAADEVATSRPYEDFTPEQQEASPLHYYTYNQSLERNYVPTTDLDTRGNLLGHPVYRYCTENTLGEELLKGSTYEGAATHVLFIAQLLIGDDEVKKVKEGEGASYGVSDVKKKMEEISDKYYSNGYYYNKADYMKKAYSELWSGLTKGEMSVLDIFGKMNDDEHDLEFPKYVTSITLDGTDVTLTGTYMDDHVEDGIFELVPAEIISGDGRVMLGLKEAYKDKELIVKGGATERATDEEVRMNSNQLLSAVYEFAGYADYFKNGMMYYYVPIRHVVAERGEGVPYQLGDIGVVRNHWYEITVNSVKRPGIPVSDPDQPIIPNVDPADQYLGLDIHILPWHVINQSIDLK